MNIADFHEARKFMELVNTWFYKTRDREYSLSVSSVVQKLHFLSEYIQSSQLNDQNLCIIYDISDILIQQITENCTQNSSQFSPFNSISQSCTNINDIGKAFFKNEPLLLSASKYKSLDTLAGCFTSVQAAGSLIKSHTDDSFIGNSSCKDGTASSPMALDLHHNIAQTGRSSLPAIVTTRDTTSETLENGLQRESTWERGLQTLPATSSPVNSITEGLGHVSLDEIDGEVIIKLCNDTKSNMDRIERLLKKSLNRTHNLSKASVINAPMNSPATKKKINVDSPLIRRGSVGRFSLGAARLPVPKKNTLTPKAVESPKKIIYQKPRSSANATAGTTSVIQNANRNILTAKRKISSLTSLRDLTPQTNSKLKMNGKGNSVSNIPSLRNGNLQSPRSFSRCEK